MFPFSSARPVRLFFAALLPLLCLHDAAAQGKPAPDVLLFTNGDQLTGKLVRAAGSSVVFKSDMAGEITVPLASVKELHSGTEFVALRKADKGKVAEAGKGLVQVAGGNVMVGENGGATAATIAPKDLGYLIDKATYDKQVARKAGPLEGWNGALTAGITVVRSTDNSTTVTAGVNLVRAIPTVPYLPKRNRTAFDVTESYGKLTTLVIPPPAAPAAGTILAKTSIFHSDFERDEYFSPRLYALGELSFDHNYSQGLQLQQVYGAGAGWTPFQDAKQELNLKGDVHYEIQQFIVTAGVTASPTLNLFGSTFAESYRRTFARKLVFTEIANYLPAWNNLNAYSANVTGSLALPVFKRLSASVSMTDNYLNNPATVYNLKNSYQFVTGITYTLH